MKIGFAEQIRNVDRLSIEKYGISGLKLMHNAAKAVCEEITNNVSKDASVCILCGKGNNGGDGLALASMLVENCSKVFIMMLCGHDLSDDAQYYFDKLDSKVIITETLPSVDVYIDAVFGTGFSGKLPNNIAMIFRRINQSKAFKVAVDIPSGVAADTANADIDAFKADVCVTFEILKYAHLLPQAAVFCGKTVVKDIGLDTRAIEKVNILTETIDHFCLPPKNPMAHKGTNGTLWAVVGCRKYQGAAALSVQSALRSGCGIVMAFVPNSIYLPVASKTQSAIICPCSEQSDGIFSYEMIDEFQKQFEFRHPNAILIGSGMGIAEDVGKIVANVLSMNIPCIVDGDALRYVTNEMLSVRTTETILTPHLGEFARMISCDMQELMENRFAYARKYATENQIVLVLKDAVTIISFPDGSQKVLYAPNPAMAKGGSGDVLAGMIGSFLAQGFGAAAAEAGVWFHSQAGREAHKALGEYAMLPSDVISYLPTVLK